MIRSPKTRFHEKPADVSWLGELVATPQFANAMDTALAQYLFGLPSIKDAHGSMAMSHKLEGAREFIFTFMTLADKGEAPVKRKDYGNLPGNVRNDEPVKKV